MAWPDLSDPASAVEFIMCIACLLMGLSHIVQPKMWRDYFTFLHGQGFTGVITRTCALELWPALIIVAFHQVWAGPGLVLTLYGWLLLGKCIISLLAPRLGLRSLAMARSGDKAFVFAGLLLMALGATAGLALAGR